MILHRLYKFGWVLVVCFTTLAATVTADESEKQSQTVVSEYQASAESKTLQNLMTAYYAELNEFVQYKAFATRAEEEGFTQAAKLFKAMSRAEQIHAARKASLIITMGGNPTVELEPIIIMSTQENIVYAALAEEFEMMLMYPQYVVEARYESYEEAARLFEFATKTEPAHYELCKLAADTFDKFLAQNTSYQLCTVCGMIYGDETIDDCGVCELSVELFERID